MHSVYRYLYPHTERQIIWVPHIETHHLMAQVRNSSDCFFIVVCLQVSTSTHWDAKTKTTTYCQIAFDGFSAEQLQMFLDWVALTGICGHTFIDRLRHHHILTLLAWCSSWWTLRCVSSFNYFNRRQFTHTNTKCNSYLRNDSCCYRGKYNLHLKLNRLTKKQYYHAKHQHWCSKMGLAPFFKHHGKLHHLNNWQGRQFIIMCHYFNLSKYSNSLFNSRSNRK